MNRAEFTSSGGPQFEAKRQASVNTACVLNNRICILSFSRTKGADIRSADTPVRQFSYLPTFQNGSRG